MEFYATINLSNLPFAMTERKVINGKEQECLVLPVNDASLRKGKQGGWFAHFLMREFPANQYMTTHTIEYVPKAHTYELMKELNWNPKWKNNSGRMRKLTENDSLKLYDYTNNMTPIVATGMICLSDIREDDIEIDPYTGMKYVRVTFRKTPLLDVHNNSHEIVLTKPSGEIQLGKFREWPEASEQVARLSAMQESLNQSNDQPSAQTPEKIGGLNF